MYFLLQLGVHTTCPGDSGGPLIKLDEDSGYPGEYIQVIKDIL